MDPLRSQPLTLLLHPSVRGAPSLLPVLNITIQKGFHDPIIQIPLFAFFKTLIICNYLQFVYLVICVLFVCLSAMRRRARQCPRSCPSFPTVAPAPMHGVYCPSSVPDVQETPLCYLTQFWALYNCCPDGPVPLEWWFRSFDHPFTGL